MDDQHLARDFGRLLAASTAQYAITVEAQRTQSPIFSHPVELEPHFEPFDPLQTFVHTDRQHFVTIPPPAPWRLRRIILPDTADVDARRAEAMTAALAGCNAPMSFELIATPERAEFYLGAQPADITVLANTWLGVYPTSAVVPATDPLSSLAPAPLVLVDLYSPAGYHRAVRSAGTPWRTLLRFCTGMQGHDVLFCQVLFVPARHRWQHNIASILEAERALGHRAPQGRTTNAKNLAEPLFAVTIRLGSTTPALRHSIEAFPGTLTADGMPFRYRTLEDYQRVLDNDGVVDLLRRRVSYTLGQLFTSSELSLLVHPPDSAAAGLVHLDIARGLTVPDALRHDGIPLGENHDRGLPMSVVQPDGQQNKSAWLIGASRKGKSTMLIQRARHLALRGSGVGLIDPHRTTAFALLGALDDVPPERVLFLDFDAEIPVAYNPFSHSSPEDVGRLTTEFVHSMKHLFDAASFHRMAHFLGMGIYASFVLKSNLATLPILFARATLGEQLRRRVIAEAANASVRRFWRDEFPSYSPDAFAPLVNRLSALLLDDRTYRTFAQTENRVDLASAMDEGLVVIIAPPASIEAASIVGGMFVAQAQHAAFRRTGTPRAAHHFHFIIDEFHRFISSANTLQSIIDEASKGGLSVCLAHQETGQVPNELLKALYSMPNIFIFGVNLPDAKMLAHLFNGQVTPETLACQPTGAVHARLGHEIANFTCPPPIPISSKQVERIIAHNRATYHASTAPAPLVRGPRIINTIAEE